MFRVKHVHLQSTLALGLHKISTVVIMRFKKNDGSEGVNLVLGVYMCALSSKQLES